MHPVLFVGSCPGHDAEHAMRTMAAGAGDLAFAIPDGERGDRRYWVNYLAYRLYAGHPDLETVRKPTHRPGKEDWVPTGYDDFWQFRVRDGVDSIHFDGLGYLAPACESYALFRRLRAEGVIAGDTRFQVCLPLTDSGTRIFMHDARTFAMVRAAFEEAMEREIAAIVAAIPVTELALQWDICIEVLEIATDDHDGVMLHWRAPGDPFDRYQSALRRLTPLVPAAVPVGLHLCYGDLYKRHLVEPADLALAVRMANTGAAAAGRPIAYVHVPVPVNRDDDAYFRPLADLSIGATTLVAGLIHDSDGAQGCHRRLGALRRRWSGPLAVATECGSGGRSLESIDPLLALHREIAIAAATPAQP